MKNNLVFRLGDFFFKKRSYIPVPFLLVALIFMEPTSVTLLTGFAVALCGELIRIWSVSYAGSETRTTSGVGGTYLVTQGPYSIVRNPLYIANILIYTGIGVMSNALFPWLQIFGLVFFTFQYYCIIRIEEGFLSEKFGRVYASYKNSVNRFLPGTGNVPSDILSKLEMNVSGGLRSEKRSIQAFLISSLIILIGYGVKKFL